MLTAINSPVLRGLTVQLNPDIPCFSENGISEHFTLEKVFVDDILHGIVYRGPVYLGPVYRGSTVLILPVLLLLSNITTLFTRW